jgi:S-(hydroxymethyl)glutathione dehydrogenase/alcohol dehydrogenase
MTKAAVLHAYDSPLVIESLTMRDPRPDEVRVKMGASGVCHSDLSVIRAKLPVPPPSVLGHEGAGVVEAVGKAVTSLKPGDHVVLSWVDSCGRCVYCVSGKPHLCETTMVEAMTGQDDVFSKGDLRIGRMAGVGSFSEKTIVRERAAIKIDPAIPLDRACLVGCGVMTGVGAAINTVQMQPGDTVAVFGCGGVGLNVIQGAALSGAGHIIAVDLSPRKLEMAKTFGATDIVQAGGSTDVPMAIKGLTGGLGVDYAFEVIGVADVILQAYQSIRRGGAVVVVGVAALDAMAMIPAGGLVLEEKRVLGSLYGSTQQHRDMPKLLDLYKGGKLKIDELVSRRIALDEVNAAFEAMEAGEVARSVIVY